VSRAFAAAAKVKSAFLSHLISIIVPVFNEGETIGEVVARLLTISLPADREVIVVDDGSRDATQAVLRRLAGGNSQLIVIHAEQNRGKGAAVRLGLAKSRGTVTAIQDADLELDPADLADLVVPILSGEADAVYGSRFLAGSPGVPLMTRVANGTLTSLTNLLFGSSLTDMETCYKIMRGDLARGLNLTANRFDIEPEITAQLLLGGYRIVEKPVKFSPRSRAAGKKIRWHDGVQAVRTLIGHRFGRT
jgi:glycosyltransferase involved in cell wall biosynthesis